jgi:tripartite-type tricarboxylate transporter receptor subunit TctC
MNIPRRSFLHLAAGALAVPTLSRPASAADYPARPVRVIVGFSPGSAADVVSRVVAQPLSQRIGQSVITETRPGAGGTMATELVIKAPSDGYTLLMATVANSINATLYPNLNYDFTRDIAPVALIGSAEYAMVVNPSVPAANVDAFITYAKANPGKINMASPGNGTAPHVFGELFQMMAGIRLVHVPYRSSYLPDLIGGQVQVAFTPVPLSIEFIRTGKLRALALTGAEPSDALPNVPTVGQTLSGYAASGWFGLVAPKGTPAAIVDRLNKETSAVVADPDMKARLVDLGVPPLPLPVSSAAFGTLIADDTEKWAKVIRAANITAD